jgi:hypothetical protein
MAPDPLVVVLRQIARVVTGTLEPIAQLVLEIETVARQEREKSKLKTLGPKAILAQGLFDRPEHPKKSPAPLFHAIKREVRKALWEAYAWFVAAFREAAEKLRAGDLPIPHRQLSTFPTLRFRGSCLSRAYARISTLTTI